MGGSSYAVDNKKPHLSIFLIVTKLPADKALEEGEEYEYIPIEPLETKGAGGPGKHSTPKRGDEPVTTALAKQLNPRAQELQQIMSAAQLEMKSRQDGSLGLAQDVSSILQTLLKEGPQDKYPQDVSFYWGKGQGEVSFEQWSYELQTLRKSYSDSALRKEYSASLRGDAVDTVHNMRPSVSLDMIIKRFTIV